MAIPAISRGPAGCSRAATDLKTRLRPGDDDGQRLIWVASAVARAAALAGAQKDPIAYGDRIAARVLPDTIPYQTGTRANYAVDKFNGRRPSDDAMDAALSLFSGVPVADNAAQFDRHPRNSPYLVPVGADKGGGPPAAQGD